MYKHIRTGGLLILEILNAEGVPLGTPLFCSQTEAACFAAAMLCAASATFAEAILPAAMELAIDTATSSPVRHRAIWLLSAMWRSATSAIEAQKVRKIHGCERSRSTCPLTLKLTVVPITRGTTDGFCREVCATSAGHPIASVSDLVLRWHFRNQKDFVLPVLQEGEALLGRLRGSEWVTLVLTALTHLAAKAVVTVQRQVSATTLIRKSTRKGADRNRCRLNSCTGTI